MTVAACGGSTEPIHANPPAPDPQPPPSASAATPAATAESTPAPQASGAPMRMNPPPPAPNRTFTIAKSAGKCAAMEDVQCPSGATCNPPPPQPYPCPANVTSYPAKLTEHADTGACTVRIHSVVECPRGMNCNPPPPHDDKVPCPK